MTRVRRLASLIVLCAAITIAAAGCHKKVPQPAPNGAFFRKSAFVIDLEARTVSCPGGQTTSEFREDAKGARIFQFDVGVGQQQTAARGAAKNAAKNRRECDSL